MSLEAFAAVVSALSSAKQAFDPESTGGGGGVSAETQSGGTLEYTPVGLESLDITPFEYALLDDLYKQQEEEPEEMMYGGPVYAEEGGGLETLFEDDLFQDVVFEDVDASMETPTEPTFGRSDPDKSSQDIFFEEDEKINRQRRKDFMADTLADVVSYVDLLADSKNLLNPETRSSVRGRGNIVPGSRGQRGRSLSNRDLRVGGTTVNPFEYRQYRNGGKVDGVLDRRMFAANPMLNGGDIRGPGGPKDDLIPVMASNGEFMLSKAAVDQAGGGNHSKGIAMLEQFNNLGNRRYG